MKRWIIGVTIIITAIPVAWYLISPIWRVQELEEVSPLEQVPISAQPEEAKQQQVQKTDSIASSLPAVIARGAFVSQAHGVSGSALLIEQDDARILRFENFETVNGPDLHIYLSTDTSAKDFVDLGVIRATKGNVNYPVASDIDIKKYNTVLIWCVPFRILFSSAQLQ
ncbi:MAG: DM13 domain-containing protein [Candidatus Uhrbacteria bacterium]|nr:DM13 domain-containing protein [Candidatus Uhrbacteria bacterium]